MTIYLDAVWALNFLLDMMLLMLTHILSKDNTRRLRIAFGAFIASLIVPISLYYPDTFLTTVVGKLLFSIVIILCAFRFSTIYQSIKQLLLFYFITFTIGGGLIGIHFLFKNPIMLSSNGLFKVNNQLGDPVSWLFIMIGFPLVWIFMKRQMDKHAIEKIRYDQLCPVVIQLKGRSFSTMGYIDSGNQLVDPISKQPVIICDEEYISQWFSIEEWKLIKQSYHDLDFSQLPKQWEDKIKIVPYQGVEGKSSFLIAIRPDQLIIYYNQKKIITTKVLIGIQFARLTKDRSYHCLIQPQIIKLATVESA